MKKGIMVLLSVMMVAAISSQVFASEYTSSYTWKAIRGGDSCTTTVTGVSGLIVKREVQVQASSLGDKKGGVSKSESRLMSTSLMKNLSVTDNTTPKSDAGTYHNTAINDGTGWYGQSCYMTQKGTDTLTRII